MMCITLLLTYGGQKTTLWGQISPSTLTTVLGIRLSSVYRQMLLPLRHLTGPGYPYYNNVCILFYALCLAAVFFTLGAWQF